MEEEFLTVKDLRERGWTLTLIRDLLGKEDCRLTVDHWANWSGKKAYLQHRVEEIEITDEFRDLFLKSARRRRFSKKAIRDVLKRLKTTEEKLATMPPEKERQETKDEQAIRTVVEIFNRARRHGYRTPHKGL